MHEKVYSSCIGCSRESARRRVFQQELRCRKETARCSMFFLRPMTDCLSNRLATVENLMEDAEDDFFQSCPT